MAILCWEIGFKHGFTDFSVQIRPRIGLIIEIHTQILIKCFHQKKSDVKIYIQFMTLIHLPIVDKKCLNCCLLLSWIAEMDYFYILHHLANMKLCKNGSQHGYQNWLENGQRRSTMARPVFNDSTILTLVSLIIWYFYMIYVLNIFYIFEEKI